MKSAPRNDKINENFASVSRYMAPFRPPIMIPSYYFFTSRYSLLTGFPLFVPLLFPGNKSPFLRSLLTNTKLPITNFESRLPHPFSPDPYSLIADTF